MDTVFILLIIVIFAAILLIGLKHTANSKHDFSGDLEKEKESYELSILKFIDHIKATFKN